MRFLIHSEGGDGAALGWKLQEEGHDVLLFIKESSSKSVLTGMVPKVASMEEGLAKRPDVILFGMSGSGKEADALRDKGFRVVGGGDFCDLIELDRSFAMNLAKKVGMKVPEFTVFKKTEIFKAIQFVEETGKRYVLKPDGHAGLDLTYVAKDPGDMIQELGWIDKKKILKCDFLLQEFVEGVELSTEMWFSQGDPVPTLCNGTIEQKKFLAGNLGPNTGCESSVVWPYDSMESKIVKQTMGKMIPIIKKYGYTGPIDVNAIINDGEAYFLEFTPRFGYSAIYGFAELIDSPLGEFFYNLATRNTADLTLKKKVSMAVTVSMPPYPINSDLPMNQEPLRKTAGKRLFNPPDEGFWPYDVKSDGQELVSAGTIGLIAYITASGSTVEEAEANVYEKVEEFSVPDGQYRVDGAMRAEKDIPKLKMWGYELPPLIEEEDAELEDGVEEEGD